MGAHKTSRPVGLSVKPTVVLGQLLRECVCPGSTECVQGGMEGCGGVCGVWKI